MSAARMRMLLLAWLICGLAAACSSAAAAEPVWRLQQPTPAGSGWPIGLGHVGDIEFWAPNRGVLITSGVPPTIPPGVWAYNGQEWHEMSEVCGATNGRIAWAGPGEFWTVSDGRAGQANEVGGNGTEQAVSVQDNTLCHFAGGQVVGSYAHPANEPDSYMAMSAAACLSSTDCWFGGEPLAEPQVGGFHLRWNGSTVENVPYVGVGHAIDSMQSLEGRIYESVRVKPSDRTDAGAGDAAVHRINPAGSSPEVQSEEGLFQDLPASLYEGDEPPEALEYLHLSAAGGALWAAAGRSGETFDGARQGQLTVVRDVKREWTQLIGPEHPLPAILPRESEEVELLKVAHSASEAAVAGIAVEPGSGDAWLALAPREGTAADPRAVLVRLSSEGAVLEEQTLPSDEEVAHGIGAKGAVSAITCPAAGDCWLATTGGWLFHLAPAGEESLPRDPRESEYFTGLIAFRPQDQGLPQVTADAPPPDVSGAPPPEALPTGTFKEEAKQQLVTLPLVSSEHSRLLHGSTLELRFHLSVKARVQLVAKRHRMVVARTAKQTLKAGNRSVRLPLDPRDWPTELKLETHALAPLRQVPSAGGEGANITTETTGLRVLPFQALKGLL